MKVKEPKIRDNLILLKKGTGDMRLQQLRAQAQQSAVSFSVIQGPAIGIILCILNIHLAQQ